MYVDRNFAFLGSKAAAGALGKGGGGGDPALDGKRSDAYWQKGTACVSSRMNSYGSGSTSNRPIPPRTAILPLRNGSHANPMRGSKLWSVGFDNKRGPTLAHFPGTSTPQTGSVSDRLRRLTIFPLISVGTVAIS